MLRRLRAHVNQNQESFRQEREFVADLAAHGLHVESINDLMRDLDYRDQVPVLVDWLERAEDLALREMIVRVLSVPWAKPYAVEPLLREFRRDHRTELYRWTVGSAIEALNDRTIGDELIPLVTDRRWGISRQMLVEAVGVTNHPAAVTVLTGLLDDPEVSGHATVALRRTRDPEARGGLDRMLRDSRDWVRDEARRGLAELDQ